MCIPFVHNTLIFIRCWTIRVRRNIWTNITLFVLNTIWVRGFWITRHPLSGIHFLANYMDESSHYWWKASCSLEALESLDEALNFRVHIIYMLQKLIKTISVTKLKKQKKISSETKHSLFSISPFPRCAYLRVRLSTGALINGNKMLVNILCALQRVRL